MKDKDPVRLFIGSSANGEDALIEMAYEYTLRKNTDRDLEIIWMRQTNDTESFWHGFSDHHWSTPFSGFRWGIPEYCNFEGKAIYTDCDMLNYCDIGELMDLEIPDDKMMLARDGKRFGGKEFCVILFDCAKFKDKFPVSKEWKHHPQAHHQFIDLFIVNNLVGQLDPQWNSHDGDVVPFKQLHFTTMQTQPWRPSWFTGESLPHPNLELVELFWNAVECAQEEGYNRKDYMPRDVVTYNIIGR
jgi:lipopolysaccharide biosynthesis glycosyltransferase|tara:strand:+ start:1047 stop:1778 length:732 start_codon:yes stop_codon:yes gene_type:complete